MKIALAQTNPVIGDVSANITNHIKLCELAASAAADWIFFPELSLTGYVPELADDLATDLRDDRLKAIQEVCCRGQLSVGFGMPVRAREGICIALVVAQLAQPLRALPKRYLHADEEPFFECGSQPFQLLVEDPPMALGICYEISVDAHLAEVQASAAHVYLASVVKSVNGTAKAHQRLSYIARELSIPALMVNSIGKEDGTRSGGRSAAWNRQGELIGELSADQQGLLLVNVEEETVSIYE